MASVAESGSPFTFTQAAQADLTSCKRCERDDTKALPGLRKRRKRSSSADQNATRQGSLRPPQIQLTFSSPSTPSTRTPFLPHMSSTSSIAVAVQVAQRVSSVR